MKTLLGIALCLLLISCEYVDAPYKDRSGNATPTGQEAYPNPDSTFRVKNYTTTNVGAVVVHLVDSTVATLNVSDSGEFSTHISAAPASCTVHDHDLLYSTPTWIPIDSHTSVHATWTSNVVVIDQSEMN